MAGWFYLAADTPAQVYATDRSAWVPLTDPEYVAFLASGCKPASDTTAAAVIARLAAAQPVAALIPVQLTPLQFVALFTPAEQQAIAQAALANAAVFLWFSKAMGATYIVLSDPQTVAGLAALVAAGLLTAARQAQVLANQPPAAA
jgi:hypothetical protein